MREFTQTVVGDPWPRVVQKKSAAGGRRMTCGCEVHSCEALQESSLMGYLTFTSICLGFASSRLGKLTINNPSLNSARILSASMKVGSVKLRRNSP